MEYLGSVIKGIYRDQLFDAEGVMKQDSGWNNNTIMTSFHTLLARLVTHDTKLFIQTPSLIMRFGRFSNSWGSSLVVEPADEKLTAAYTEFVLDETSGLKVVYLNDNGVEQISPSNWVQITATLGPNLPVNDVCPLGEFAVYLRWGTPTANNPAPDNDHIINHVRHPVISKSATDTLIRQIRFTF